MLKENRNAMLRGIIYFLITRLQHCLTVVVISYSFSTANYFLKDITASEILCGCYLCIKINMDVFVRFFDYKGSHPAAATF